MKILSKNEFRIELGKILTYGSNDITINTEDVEAFAKDKDSIAMCIVEDSSFHTLQEAIKLATLNFEADSILVYFKVNDKKQIMELSEMIHRMIDNNLLISIFGVSFDDNISENDVKTTLFISSSKKQNFNYLNNYIVEEPI
ncbi:hypothetical protein [Candidatus Sulfurimonas baltica]|uniref:Cell division protein FtsZ C-terminal domain-containing protein n=1 Tax=Candidatus Sulfurimonas baltica TaxID=2740404 RepID=A0A7S7LX80_9BACT|nr:hypothetical protein [Candidatus Sulfurimonas baltica]QOY53031.1 hypothetical protein HUE88_04940 [Candidatus Sulfurimonas baltica]